MKKYLTNVSWKLKGNLKRVLTPLKNKQQLFTTSGSGEIHQPKPSRTAIWTI